MIGNFPASLTHVLASEGAYVNNPHDPGGATNQGVTQHQYDMWRIAHGQPTRSVAQIDPNEVEAFYHSWYWKPVQGDALPSGVDYCVFDCAVNSGPHEAALMLQRAVDVADDGVIGAVTLAAVKAADPRTLIQSFCNERLAFEQTLSTWPYFGRGWSSRVLEVEADAEGMV
jgi:lysozyme family protein